MEKMISNLMNFVAVMMFKLQLFCMVNVFDSPSSDCWEVERKIRYLENRYE